MSLYRGYWLLSNSDPYGTCAVTPCEIGEKLASVIGQEVTWGDRRRDGIDLAYMVTALAIATSPEGATLADVLILPNITGDSSWTGVADFDRARNRVRRGLAAGPCSFWVNLECKVCKKGTFVPAYWHTSTKWHKCALSQTQWGADEIRRRGIHSGPLGGDLAFCDGLNRTAIWTIQRQCEFLVSQSCQ